MRIGVDLGGTKIAAVVLDSGGQERAAARVPTPQGDYAATVQAIVGLVAALERQVGASGLAVGIGTPGTLDPQTQTLRGCNSTCLNDQPLRADLEQALERPIGMANDANCLLLSELTDGVAVGRDVVFGVILGTGVGGAIAVNGQLLSGVHGIAGEWGHTVLPGRHEGRACWCGRLDCVEVHLSGPALARRARRPQVEQLVADLEQRQPAAAIAYVAWLEDLARALAGVINLLDPDMIVFGGGLSQLPQLYTRLPPLLAPHVFAPRIATLLCPAQHGAASGVRGAARLQSAREH